MNDQLGEVLDEVWQWLDSSGYDPRTMHSGDVLMVDAAWRAALASRPAVEGEA